MPKSRPTVILGARGLVGSALMKALRDEAPLALNREECDLTRPDQMLKVMDRLRPRVFINAAAWTDVDGCESHPETARQVNALGPGRLAQAAREIGCLLVHLSTDFVFDGKADRPYREDDRPAPLSVYGRSKLEGEEAVQDAGGDWLIVRTSWVFGYYPHGFVWKIIKAAREGRAIRVVDDQTGSPTFAPDLAQGVGALLRVKASGLFHVVNQGQASWWDLARRALDLSGFGHKEAARTTAAEYGLPAPRPGFSVLDAGKFHYITGRSLRAWPEALAEALAASGEAGPEGRPDQGENNGRPTSC